MPIARVKMPDGRIARIEVPEGTTPEQAIAMAQRVVPKERPESFGQGFLEGLSKTVANTARTFGAPTLASGNPVTGPIGGGLLRVGAAALDALQGKQSRQANSRGSTGGRITGQIVGSIPTMMMPGGPVIQGAAGGVVMSDNMDNRNEMLANAAVGAVAGYGGKVLGDKVVAPIAKKVAPKIMRAVRGAPPPRAVTPVNPALDPAIVPLGRDAAVRAARFERVGVQTPTTAMVTRNPRAWNFEQEGAKLAGVGDDLQRQIMAVDFDLANAGRNLVDDAGGAIGPEATGLRVSQALAARNEALREGVSGLYTQAREQAGEAPVAGLDNLWSRMADPTLRNNPKFGQMGNAVTNLLKDFGVIDDVGANVPGKQLTVGQAEELRKFVGTLGSDTDSADRMFRKTLQDAIDADVLDNVGGDAFKQARQAAAARFQEFRNTYPGRLIETNKPEAIGAQVLKGNPAISDLRQLRQSLSGAGEQGQAALQALRAQMVDDLVRPFAPTEGGVNGGQLWKAFQRSAPRLRAIMEPGQYKDLRRFAVAARDATSAVPRSNVNYSNSASTIANLFPEAAAAQSGGIFGRLAKRAVGAGTGALFGGPLGAGVAATAMDVAEAAGRTRAEQVAAQQLGMRMRYAANPQTAAQALLDAQEQAAREAMLRPYIEGTARALTLPTIAGATSTF